MPCQQTHWVTHCVGVWCQTYFDKFKWCRFLPNFFIFQLIPVLFGCLPQFKCFRSFTNSCPKYFRQTFRCWRIFTAFITFLKQKNSGKKETKQCWQNISTVLYQHELDGLTGTSNSEDCAKLQSVFVCFL